MHDLFSGSRLLKKHALQTLILRFHYLYSRLTTLDRSICMKNQNQKVMIHRERMHYVCTSSFPIFALVVRIVAHLYFLITMH